MWTAREANRFVVGVNLPWIGYGTDVGASAWFPEGGLGQHPSAASRLDATLAALARDGISVVRVFVLCDARSGVRFDTAGDPLGLDAAVFRDLDVMVAMARVHRVRLMPVLLDFHLCGPKRLVDGVQLGGHSRVIADGNVGRAFINRVLEPIVHRYADDDTVIAWDLINEPEWCLRGSPLFRRASVSFEAMQDFLGEAVRCVKRTASQPVTVGSAGTWRLDLVRPIGLDFYQVHWYERFGWAALARPVAELGLDDRPVILGEFAGRSTRVTEVLDAAERAGYEGALVWSVLAEDKHSAYPVALAQWSRTQRSAIDRRGSA
jgi:hypothetical protein